MKQGNEPAEPSSPSAGRTCFSLCALGWLGGVFAVVWPGDAVATGPAA